MLKFFSNIVAFSVLISLCCPFFFTFTSYLIFFVFSIEHLILPKYFRPTCYRLSDLILSRFNGNIFFMPTSGLQKNPKHLKRNLIQIFHDNSFLSPFFVFVPFCFGLIGFDLYYIGLWASYCIIRQAKKCVFAFLFFKSEGAS